MSLDQCYILVLFGPVIHTGALCSGYAICVYSFGTGVVSVLQVVQYLAEG